MSDEYGLNRVPIVEQLFGKRRQVRKVGLLVAKVVYHFLVFGLSAEITHFFDALNSVFPLGSDDILRELRFLGFSITFSHDGSATIDMG